MQLYQLTQNYNNLQELLDNPEIPKEVIEESLKSIDEDITEKLQGIGKVIKNIEGESAAVDTEIKRLQELKKSKANSISNLKDYVYNSMKITEKDKVKTPLFTFSIAKNPDKVEIEEGAKVPKKFIKVTEEVMKKELLNALKEGKKIKGIKIVHGEGLRFR